MSLSRSRCIVYQKAGSNSSQDHEKLRHLLEDGFLLYIIELIYLCVTAFLVRICQARSNFELNSKTDRSKRNDREGSSIGEFWEKRIMEESISYPDLLQHEAHLTIG